MKHYIFKGTYFDLLLCIEGRHVSINYGDDDVTYHDFENAERASRFYNKVIFTMEDLRTQYK